MAFKRVTAINPFPTMLYIVAVCLLGLWLPSIHCSDLAGGNASCHEGIPQLRNDRLQVILDWVQVIASLGPYAGNLSLQRDTAALRLASNATMSVLGAGRFGPGPEQVMEYAALYNPILNGERISYEGRQVLVDTIGWANDTLFFETIDTVRVGKHVPIVQRTHDEVTFRACSIAIDHYKTQIVLDALELLSQKYSPTPQESCSALSLYCPSGLFPYRSMLQCVQYMKFMPQRCLDGMNLYQGDTLQCRQLYLSSAFLDPASYCSQLGIISQKCQPQSCMNHNYSLAWDDRTTEDEWGRSTQILVASLTGATILVCCLLYIIVGSLGLHRVHSAVQAAKRVGMLDSTRMARACSSGKTNDLTIPIPKRADIITPCGILVKHLVYKVNGSTRLHDVYGHFRPGELTAIMGPSGCGKSTLMTLLLARKSEGEYNGTIKHYTPGVKEQYDENWVRKHCGFVEQFCNLPQMLTIFETLMYEALMVLPVGTTMDQIMQQVLELLSECNLMFARHTPIAVASGGQKKLASIAVELLRPLSCLFLDEPTSGLDAGTAWSIMNRLAGFAHNKQQTIVVSIHQPRNKIFDLIDKLMLLIRGGFTLFFGHPDDILHVLRQHDATYVSKLEKEIAWEKLLGTKDAVPGLISVFQYFDPNLEGHITPARLVDALLTGDADEEQRLELQKYLAENFCNQATINLQQWLEHLMKITSAAKEDSFKDQRIGSLELGNDDCQTLSGLLSRRTSLPKVPCGQTSYLNHLAKVVEERINRKYNIRQGKDNAQHLAHTSPADMIADILNAPNAAFLSDKGLAGQLDKYRMKVLNEDDVDLEAFDCHQSARDSTHSIKDRLPGLWSKLAIRIQRAARSLRWFELSGSIIGGLVTAGVILSLSPQVELDSMQHLYLFGSLLLIAASALSCIGFFNGCIPWVQHQKPALDMELLNGSITGIETFLFWWIRDSFFGTISTLVFFVPYYYGVGYNVASLSTLQCFAAFLLLSGMIHAFGNTMALLCPPSAATLTCGLWMTINALLAGILIPVNNLSAFWRPWGAYISPFFHMINVFLSSLLVGRTIRCPADVPAQFCPPLGVDALEQLSYGQFNTSESLLILFAMMVVHAAAFGGTLLWISRMPQPRHNPELQSQPLLELRPHVKEGVWLGNIASLAEIRGRLNPTFNSSTTAEILCHSVVPVPEEVMAIDRTNGAQDMTRQ